MIISNAKKILHSGVIKIELYNFKLKYFLIIINDIFVGLKELYNGLKNHYPLDNFIHLEQPTSAFFRQS